MKSGRRRVSTGAALAMACGGLWAGCAYGGEAEPGGSRSIDAAASASGGMAGQAFGSGSSGSSTSSGAGGSSGDITVETGGGAGSLVAPDEAGAIDAADEAVSTGDPTDTGVLDVGTHDAVAVDVAKPPPLLFDPAKLYFIKPTNGSPGIAMDVDQNSQTNGARVKQWTFSAGDNAEQFHILDNGNKTWRVAMKDNQNQCLDNPGNQTTDGTKLQMWQCMSNDVWQEWDIVPDASAANTFQLKNVGSNLLLDEPASMTTIDLTLQVYTQNGTNAQKWIITPTM